MVVSRVPAQLLFRFPTLARPTSGGLGLPAAPQSRGEEHERCGCIASWWELLKIFLARLFSGFCDYLKRQVNLYGSVLFAPLVWLSGPSDWPLFVVC